MVTKQFKHSAEVRAAMAELKREQRAKKKQRLTHEV